MPARARPTHVRVRQGVRGAVRRMESHLTTPLPPGVAADAAEAPGRGAQTSPRDGPGRPHTARRGPDEGGAGPAEALATDALATARVERPVTGLHAVPATPQGPSLGCRVRDARASGPAQAAGDVVAPSARFVEGRSSVVAALDLLVVGPGLVYPALVPVRLATGPTGAASADGPAEHHSQDGVARLDGPCSASVGPRAVRPQVGWSARLPTPLAPTGTLLRCRVLHPTPAPPDAGEGAPLGPVLHPAQVRAASGQTGVYVAALAAEAPPTPPAHGAVDAVRGVVRVPLPFRLPVLLEVAPRAAGPPVRPPIRLRAWALAVCWARAVSVAT